ncbi:MAG: hypothetical protein JWM19_803 [Actinomycetia bacterium]|nr:hypothetical protein [Actinomycetes bacterium]
MNCHVIRYAQLRVLSRIAGNGGLGMTGRRVLWICPFVLPNIPPAGISDDVDFVECHDSADVADLLSQSEHPGFDVVVVDTSPMESHGYDPVGAVSLVAARCTVPPRFLVAVVMRGLNVDYPDAKLAFAVEMHSLWGRKRPTLVVEEAFLYRFEKAPADGGKTPGKATEAGKPGDTGSKELTISQRHRWSTIAERAVLLAEGKASPGPPAISPLIRALVEAMCARRTETEGPHFSESQRRMLYALARERASVKELASTLHVGEKYVRKQQGEVAGKLAPYAEWGDTGTGRADHSAFCDKLADRYGPWLKSRSERAGDGQPGE